MKKNNCPLYLLLIYLFFSLLFGVNWILTGFGEISIDQLLFNLFSVKTGMNNSVLYDGFRYCVLYPLLCTTAVALVYSVSNAYLLSRYTLRIILKKSKKTVELHYRHSHRLLLPLALLLVTTTLLSAERLGVFEYAADKMTISTLYEDYYVAPQDMNYTFPDQPKNLIYIVLESVENSFASTDVGGARQENVIPNLTALYQNNINFTTGDSMTGFRSAYATGWTASALTAQFLGVPLSVPSGMETYDFETFLPGAFGLGDVLSLAGYNQMAVLGSDSDFGSRTALYNDHGITDILDYRAAVDRGLIPSDYFEFWGYEDDKLFEFCKTEILRLAALDAPFFLTALTVDTHFEDGYVCQHCEDNFDDQYSNVIYCSDTQVYEFVQWIQAQDFYEDTVIVIAGDHCTMDKDYLEDIPEDYVRTVYHTIINADETASQGVENQNRSYTTMDLYPTTLASMGITWDSDRLALGTNLYSDTPTLMEELGLEPLNEQIRATSTYFNVYLMYGMI